MVQSAVSPATAKDAAWERILGHILGNHAAWIIDIGLRAGLFAALAETPQGVTGEALAGRLGFDARLTGVWSRAAFAYGVLDWDSEHGYRLADDLGAILLDPEDPQYLGGRVQFYTALYEDFRAFPALLRTGASWPRSEHDPWLITALANLSRPDVAMLIAHAIPQAPVSHRALEAGGDLLEIGSGTGHHLVQYARTYPTAHLTGVEPDGPSAALARIAFADAGVADRVTLRELDANHLDDEAAFDLAVMNITLHETGGPDSWRNVLERTRAALRRNGSVLVSELPYPDVIGDYRRDPIFKMLAGVQLHEAVVGCGMITQGGLGDLLRDAGFVNVRVVSQPMRTRHVMLADR